MLLNIKEIDQETIDLIQSMLPPKALEFERIIGLEATWAMITEFGGIEIRIPERSWVNTSFAPIVEVIGEENARRLMIEFKGSDGVYIPCCTHLMQQIRNRRIIKEFDKLTKDVSGRAAVNTLARTYLLSNRQVENIVNNKYRPYVKQKKS